MGQQKSRRKYSGSIPAAVLFRSFHPRHCRLPPLLLIPPPRRERREADKEARTSELPTKEAEKQKRMLEMLGLSGVKLGEKITIAPRNDPA
jgi:hypothetical protein